MRKAGAMHTSTLTHPLETPMPHAVVASLRFIVPQPGVKPSFESAALTGGRERFFFDIETKRAPVEDVRAWPTPPTLDKEGFMLLERPTGVEDLYSDEAVDGRYRSEVARLVADTLNAEEVVVFDVTRRSDHPDGAKNPDGARQPARRIHVDYTTTSGPHRAADILGAERLQAALSAGKAVVQVNVWRPIVGPVLRSPLALADASTVESRDLVATDQVFPDRVGEIYHLAHRPTQRWGYVSRMLPTEALLIKGYDSRVDGRARFTPHVSFALPDQDGAPARHSIEVRTFAILGG